MGYSLLIDPPTEERPCAFGEENTQQTLIPLEIVDKDKKHLASLKVAKMAETGVISGSGSSAALDIDKDSDRFFIRMPGAANLGSLSVKVSTKNSDSSFDDYETEIDLAVDGDDLISQSLLLVSDNLDDDFKIDDVDDDQKNDRTHKIEVGGKFVISKLILNEEEHSVGLETEASIQNEVTIKVYNCRNLLGTTWSQNKVDDLLYSIRTRFAQCGIRINLSVSTGPIVGTLGSGSFPDYPDLQGENLIIPTASAELFDDPSVNVTDNEIGIFLVGQLSEFGGMDIGPRGISTVEKLLSPQDVQAGYANKILLSETRSEYFTPPHEVLHVILNAHHIDGSPDYPSEYANSIMLWHTPTTVGEITSTKRISQQQCEDANESPLAQ